MCVCVCVCVCVGVGMGLPWNAMNDLDFALSNIFLHNE